jgi:hypothetical protein
MRLQSWDVALGQDGPLVIEVNDMSAQDVPQIADPLGLLDGSRSSLLRECGSGWP